ncbi:MAG: K(+)-transporting ATPase subunit [Bacteroidota bacterium]|nr:K(+)-transporting ATPase subunit [Bacteroidota bacterium]
MKTHIFPAIRLTLVCLIFFSGIYTALVWGIAQFAAPNHGNGQTLSVNGKIVGYELQGQSFTSSKYFNGRPSVVAYCAWNDTTPPASGGSNKGPSNPDYLKQVQAAVDTFMLQNPSVKKSEVPAELVTASGSGLDPDISPKAAEVQISRIAKTRGLSEESISKLVSSHIDKPLLGLFGVAHVNVLKLNIDLDNLNKSLKIKP